MKTIRLLYPDYLSGDVISQMGYMEKMRWLKELKKQEK